MSLRVGVLASGAGTNLQAILDRVHGHGVEVVGVASDKPGAEALARAEAARDAAIAGWLEAREVGLVVLAGYMQLLDPGFLRRFPRVINVHPALLPAFPGIGAIQQGLDYGVKVFGVTVHFVDEGVDTGRIIAQRAVDLPDATGPDEVRDALRPLEHDLLCEAVALIGRGAVSFDPDHPRRVLVRS